MPRVWTQRWRWSPSRGTVRVLGIGGTHGRTRDSLDVQPLDGLQTRRAGSGSQGRASREVPSSNPVNGASVPAWMPGLRRVVMLFFQSQRASAGSSPTKGLPVLRPASQFLCFLGDPPWQRKSGRPGAVATSLSSCWGTDSGKQKARLGTRLLPGCTCVSLPFAVRTTEPLAAAGPWRCSAFS